MRKPLLAALTLVLAAGCSKDTDSGSENLLLKNDFESLAGWAGDVPSLTREQAHSGQYSIKTDKDLEFSVTYRNLLARLSPTRFTKVRLTAWAYVTTPNSPAKLTFQLMRSMDDNTSIYSQAIDLGQEVKKAKEWTKVSSVFTMPAEIASTNQVRLFLWRAGVLDPVYIDDVELTIEP